MRDQLRRDLVSGFTGCLDALTPRAAGNLFSSRSPAGAPSEAWWDAETRGNWLLGYTLTAHLAGDPAHLARVNRLLDALAATRDADGYIGIYPPDRRYAHPPGENGELWAQSRALLPLLARHAFTGNPDDLSAVQACAALTQRCYGPGRPYFRVVPTTRASGLTGLTHGLCYADVLEELHRLTGDPVHGAFAAWLYDDFSAASPCPNDDLALPVLLGDAPWSGHAVHTAAHLRALLFAGTVTPREDLDRARAAAAARLRELVLPHGALPGDENIRRQMGPDAAYELCTTVELGASLASLVEKTSIPSWADTLERLLFNAFQGARLTDGRAVSYLSADTRTSAIAAQRDATAGGRGHGRFKFSPTHDDVACCCAPNAGRALPEYVGRAWMATLHEPGLALVLYGPLHVRAVLGGAHVELVAHTRYPFGDDVRLEVRTSEPAAFALYLRQPAWAPDMTVHAAGADVRAGTGWWRLHRTWPAFATVTIDFRPHVEVVPYATGHAAVLRGPLQFVMPVPHRAVVTRDHALPGFHDADLVPRDARAASHPEIRPEAIATRPEVVRSTLGDGGNPWEAPPVQVRLGGVTLVPMGSAPLRVAGVGGEPGRRG